VSVRASYESLLGLALGRNVLKAVTHQLWTKSSLAAIRCPIYVPFCRILSLVILVRQRPSTEHLTTADVERFSELIDDVYDASLDPTLCRAADRHGGGAPPSK
jgi:hypothetical protein